MNKTELKTALEKANVYTVAYSLDGGLPNERYVLSQEPNGKWAVYYSERGQKTSLRFFDSEPIACQFFLEYVLQDSTVKRK